MKKKPKLNKAIDKAKRLRQKHDLNAAEAIFKKISSDYPADEFAHMELGNIYNEREDWVRAAAEYKVALGINPANKTVAEEIIKVLINQEKYEDAEDYCQKLISLDPTNSRARVHSAKIFRLKGDYTSSVKALNEALKYDEKNIKLKKFIKQINDVRGFRKTIAPYRVFFTWGMLNECNYRCKYCYVPHKNKGTLPETENVIKAWEKVYEKYGRCRIRMDGGEPSIFPDFNILVKNLSKMHNLQLNTNLSFNADEFLNNADPGYVRVDASFHPEYAKLEKFILKLKKLKEAGFKLVVSMVAYPPIIDEIPGYSRAFMKADIDFIIHPFSGVFNSKDYPKSYTAEEKKIVYNIDTESKNQMEWRQEHGPGIARDKLEREIAAIDSVEKSSFKKKERLCRMGQMYGRIYPDGNAYACCANNGFIKLGNLYGKGINLLDKAIKCSHKECRCWRCMTPGEEDRWLHTWLDDWEIPI